MPMFQGARNFVATNNKFIDNSSNGLSGIDILLAASNPQAAYDSDARAEAPRCFPGTREQFIEDLAYWAIPAVHESPLPLSWMKGAGGVGKSAVAQSFAERIGESGTLGAAYFFSINGRTEHGTLFPSIAYQLSVGFPDYEEVVERKIRRDKTLVNKTMALQFRRLIVEPLIELERQGKSIGKRIPIIIDGLDECKSVNAQCEIIRIVAASAREGTTPLCWAFFSRPESHIEATFARRDIADLCHKTILPVSHDADSDIELYPRSSFDDILQLRNLSLESPWPSDGDMKMIVEASKGLFIYAATVYRFIAQPDWLSLDEPLHTVLAVIDTKSLSGFTPTSPFADLDAFYLLIMQRIPNRILPSVRLFLAYLCLPGVVPGPVYMSNMLGLSKVEIRTLCAQLNAVIRFHEEHKPLELDQEWNLNRPFHEMPEPARIGYRLWSQINELGGEIAFYHKSFIDFLCDPDCSGDFCVATPACYELLFENLLERRLDIEQSFCLQNSELIVAPNNPNSASSLSYSSENELVDSVIKLRVYNDAITCCDILVKMVGQRWSPRQKLVTCDFQKDLRVQALEFRVPTTHTRMIHGQTGFFKYINCTKLSRSGECDGSELAADKFSKLVVALKQTIEEDEEAGIIQRYSPELCPSSEPKSLLDENSEEKVESGLYVVGRGDKAIFWFWEVNYDKRSYREFRTPDLAEGEKIYRTEPFGLWRYDG